MEAQAVRALLNALSQAERARALQTGRELVTAARARADERPWLDAFLQEFGLSNQEGIALMCLAEALLRIPDDATADRLIAEKLAAGDWAAHAGRSDSLFVNASTWALMLTGKVVELPSELQRDTTGWLRSLTQRASEPLVRQALRRAMQIIGAEFVVGRTIEAALARSAHEPALALCSFDCLGEGARTDTDARRYTDAYADAITRIAAANRARAPVGGDPHGQSSISIKLSALEPRYAATQRGRLASRLLPRAVELTRLAAGLGMSLTIDAEEQDRLEVSLEVIEALARDPLTREWPGLGLAVQAYGLRAPAVIDRIVAVARETRRRMAVRLVKGAYWDTEIKRAQERGLHAYPVFTRKASTDLSYLACARQLLQADVLYPQFATHNAHTIGAVLALRQPGQRMEFQRLHGMGGLLYDAAQRRVEQFPPVRVYAPVGPHAELLAYLVRRLLENGANTSFVNRFMNSAVPVEQLVTDPATDVAALASIANPHIPLPDDLYGAARRNSRGVDFGRATDLARLQAEAQAVPGQESVSFATAAEVTAAFSRAAAAQAAWAALPVAARVACLELAADRLEARRAQFLALLVHEAGKTLPDAVAEIREAADFCRYYAAEARRLLSVPTELSGPTGESNVLSLAPRGIFACISPWNFPLAIFTGQVVAALVTGNAVIAKPAELTPRVAMAMSALLHESGVPRDVLHCLPMVGRDFGAAALEQESLAGVVFTGSTQTALWLNRRLAARDGALLPLIAETGGINAMVVDSTALPEQVVDDVLASAFGSAGQRCSALRLLCIQEDCAEPLLAMLAGAMDELTLGNPADPATDVGPIISVVAAAALEAHVDAMTQSARLWRRSPRGATAGDPRFVAPTLIELASAADLQREVFGPILHVVRWRVGELSRLLETIRASGYGLTLGVQTRLESTRELVYANSRAGNVYVNRNMIGAVVGVQPFGGSGLSGTGPKAGGPHYLSRFMTERVLTVNTTATGGNTALLSAEAT